MEEIINSFYLFLANFIVPEKKKKDVQFIRTGKKGSPKKMHNDSLVYLRNHKPRVHKTPERLHRLQEARIKRLESEYEAVKPLLDKYYEKLGNLDKEELSLAKSEADRLYRLLSSTMDKEGFFESLDESSPHYKQHHQRMHKMNNLTIPIDGVRKDIVKKYV